MNRIRVLPDILINQIAAGEIVERPASVVKELVENSLDAGAGMIDIVIEGGGKSLVTVRDDGHGMGRDDALLAFEHHATSKIRTSEDLVAISSLGFRGEALPSIAAVSRLILRTVENSVEDPALNPGTMIEINGGVVKNVQDIPWAKGTEIMIRQLFFNMPARRKFLRADTTESAHIARLVTHYALAYPEVAFSLVNNRRRTIDVPGVKTLEERVCQLFGEQFLERLIPVAGERGGLGISGMISQPHQKRSSTDSQYYFINGRMVRDRLLTGVMSQVYRAFLPGGSYPSAILFVKIPADEIDVNVHPAKTEIRFRQPWPVQSFLRGVLEGALTRSRSFARYQPAGAPGAVSPAESEAGYPAVSATDNDYRQRIEGRIREAYAANREREYTGVPSPARRLPFQSAESAADDGWRNFPAGVDSVPCAEEEITPFSDAVPWQVLGQWRNSFIIAGGPDELIIIDQHVAHERVLYEEYLNQLAVGDVPRQKLLVPINVELTPAQMLLLEKIKDRFEDNGFEIEPFGPRSVVVKAVPAVASRCEADQLLFEILERIENAPDDYSVEEIHRRTAAGLSCRAAVKINTPLNPAKMEHLVKMLLATEDPTTCPHGRPVVLKLGIKELEKNFKRI